MNRWPKDRQQERIGQLQDRRQERNYKNWKTDSAISALKMSKPSNEQEERTERIPPVNQTTDDGHPETLATPIHTADSFFTRPETQEENHHMMAEEEAGGEGSVEDHRDHLRGRQECHLICHQRGPHKVILQEVTPTHPTDSTEAHHKYLMAIAPR